MNENKTIPTTTRPAIGIGSSSFLALRLPMMQLEYTQGCSVLSAQSSHNSFRIHTYKGNNILDTLDGI